MKCLALVFAILVHSAYAADPVTSLPFDPSVATWQTVPHPKDLKSKAFDTFLGKANYSNVHWFVSRRDGNVVAHLGWDPLSDDRPAFLTYKEGAKPDAEFPMRVQRVSDGWLAGYNRGEFGASLWWYSTDGKSKHQISKHQVNEFFTHKGRTFAVEGLSHMDISRGNLIEITKVKNQWTSNVFLELPASGEAIDLLPDGRFVIVTSDGLLAVSLEKKLDVLIPDGQWAALYPSSIAVDSKRQRVYIGMRQFVVAYDLAKNDRNWEYLIPDLKFLNKSEVP